MEYIRTKKLTDSAYSSNTPANPRGDVDGAIQEVYDMIARTNAGSSGADYQGADLMDPTDTVAESGSSTMSKIKWLFARIAWVYTQVQSMTLGQIPDDSITDVKLSSAAGQTKDLVSKKLNAAGGVLQNYVETVQTVVSVSGTATFDLSTGNNFAITLTENTNLVYTNIPSGRVCSFTIFITQPSVAKTVTHPASVKFPSNVSPDISTPSKVSILSYVTTNGGTRIYCTSITKLDI